MSDSAEVVSVTWSVSDRLQQNEIKEWFKQKKNSFYLYWFVYKRHFVIQKATSGFDSFKWTWVLLNSCIIFIWKVYGAFEADFCKGKRAGLYVDVESDCQQYLNCNGQDDDSSSINACPIGQRFDRLSCNCLESSEVDCRQNDNILEPCTRSSPSLNLTSNPDVISVKIRDDRCVNKDTGLYADVSSGCRKYYACVGGHPNSDFDYDCGPTSTFDVRKCTCLPFGISTCHVEDENIGCMSGPPPTSPPTSTVPPPPPSDFCLGKGAGYYADLNRDCEWFFVCYGGYFQTYQFQCPSHLRFNHFTCECEYPYTVLCTVFDASPCIPPNAFPMIASNTD